MLRYRGWFVATTSDYRLRSPNNRNSISTSLVDQYRALYRGGEYELVATDTDHDDLMDGTEDETPPTGGRSA